MAPELFRGGAYSERIDVYAMGICFYEVVSREWAFSGMEDEDIADTVLHEDGRPELPEWCPAQLQELIKSCWAQVADQRPSTKTLEKQLKSLAHGTWKEPPN
jgi:serine/threonine protein kinase